MAGTCYRAMFQDCTGLTTPPALPATTLAGSCYREMFMNCTALTTAPALPAVTMLADCYRDMFRNSGVKEIEVGFTAWNPSDATNNWVTYVPSGGTFKCPSALPVETGDSRIPSSWTVLFTD
jgi:hypothetical protein